MADCDDMSIDPVDFDPVRKEPRGAFPEHGTRIPRGEPYSAGQALEKALERLESWKRRHPHGD
jgi:hypothetical protein